MRMRSRNVAAVAVAWCMAVAAVATQSSIGREVAVTRHLADGEEFSMPLHKLLARGERLFTAAWTIQEGGGRPLTKGTGNPLTDRSTPLAFPRNFNRVSGPRKFLCGVSQPAVRPAGRRRRHRRQRIRARPAFRFRDLRRQRRHADPGSGE
jgi:hypothetical protein